MGLLSAIFKSKKEENIFDQIELPWQELTSDIQPQQLIEESKNRLVAIYKHSSRCGISQLVLNRFTGEFKFFEGDLVLYLLDVIKEPGISQKLVSEFGVDHESPQLILIKDGEIVHHSSHYSIRAEALSEFLEEPVSE